MLLTSCPSCQAQFKVTTEQLNVRSGRVMCGRCRNVFNAFESLERQDSAFGDIVEPAQTRGPASGHPGDLHFLRTDDPPEEPPLLEAGHFVAEASSATLPPTDWSVSEPEFSPEPSPAIAVDEPPAAAPYRYDSVRTAADPAASVSRAWSILAVLAGIVLLAQAIYFWRSSIVSHYPEARPYLAVACDQLGCTLPWGRDHAALKVEASDLIEELGPKGRFLLTATIANRGTAMQDFPHVELSLTDTNNQTLVRRILAPSDYLGRPLARAEGMRPASTTQINVKLESRAATAAGYHVELFFP